MARIEIVDMSEMADPPSDKRRDGDGTEPDLELAVIDIAKQFGKAGRLTLSEGESSGQWENRLKAAGLSENMPVITYAAGPFVYFYVNGPQPDAFLRQFAESVVRPAG